MSADTTYREDDLTGQGDWYKSFHHNVRRRSMLTITIHHADARRRDEPESILNPGPVVQQIGIKNTVTNLGFKEMIDAWGATGSRSPVLAIELGDDATAPTTSDTSIGNSVHIAALTDKTTTDTTATFRLYVPSTENNGNTYKEAGLSASTTASASVTYARVLITPTISKTSSISVTLSWSLTLSE